MPDQEHEEDDADLAEQLQRRPASRRGTGTTARRGRASPSSEGPSRMPATISPITGGWPILRKRLPSRRAATTMTMTWSSSRLKGCFRLPASAARTPVADAPWGAAVAALETTAAGVRAGRLQVRALVEDEPGAGPEDEEDSDVEQRVLGLHEHPSIKKDNSNPNLSASRGPERDIHALIDSCIFGLYPLHQRSSRPVVPPQRRRGGPESVSPPAPVL